MTNGGPGHQGRATALPAAISLAATWDVGLAYLYGTIVGSEARDLDSEGVFVGYRHHDAQNIDPLFAFGHGLSYMTRPAAGADTVFVAGATAQQSPVRLAGTHRRYRHW